MHFNDGYERKKFIKEHEKMRKEYRKAGMSDDEIDEIFLYDWDRYKEQRNHCHHNRYIAENEEFESISIEDEIYLRVDNWHSCSAVTPDWPKWRIASNHEHTMEQKSHHPGEGWRLKTNR